MKKIVLLSSLILATLSFGVQADLAFESTKDGSKLGIVATPTDTPEAKQFLATGKNPYTKLYATDPEVAKAGKKKFGYYSCTQCHGGAAGGSIGPSLTDSSWNYAKNATDKGMFETIAGGTNGGMNAWHQVPGKNPDLLTTDDILRIIGWVRSISKDPSKPWEK